MDTCGDNRLIDMCEGYLDSDTIKEHHDIYEKHQKYINFVPSIHKGIDLSAITVGTIRTDSIRIIGNMFVSKETYDMHNRLKFWIKGVRK